MNYVFTSKKLIDETLAVPHTSGKKELEPFKSFAITNNLPYKIHEHPEEFQLAEVHLTEADEWICICGRVEFVVGGSFKGDAWILERDGIKNPNEIRAKSIEDGETIFLQQDDHLFIDSGVPHMHRGFGGARSWIYKIPNK